MTTPIVIESAIAGERKWNGVLALLTELFNKDNKNKSGTFFDLVFMLLCDGLAGLMAHQMFEYVKSRVEKMQNYNRYEKTMGKDGVKDVIEQKNALEETIKKMTKDKPKLKNQNVTCSEVKNLETGAKHTGYNKNIRLKLKQKQRFDCKVPENSNQQPPISKVMENCPGVQKSSELNRPPHTCAEHHAFEKVYSSKVAVPDAKLRMNTIRYNGKTGQYTSIERCANCKLFEKGMTSNVPTDKLNGRVIPKLSDGNYLMAEDTIILAPLAAAQLNRNQKNV